MKNISLYVCTYNVEKTIEEVIIGILNLDPKPNEIIIVNDGSTDSTLEILNKYKSPKHLDYSFWSSFCITKT